jgi:nicotinate phosphoribosyltransferase
MNAALLTDKYEFTMATATRTSGAAGRMATFEVFARSVPGDRRFGVVAGTQRLIELIESIRFDADTVDWLVEDGAIDIETAPWLANYQFDGTIDGYREGELWFGHSPILTITAPFAVGTLLETLILSVLNHDSAVATAAARMRLAAGDRRIIDMGTRRTHEQAAVDAARAAWIGGIDATSNLAAARMYDIPSAGTAAHAFILAHLSNGDETAAEIEAFTAQIAALGVGTTLLVDTFDIPTGIRNAVTAARQFGATGPGAIRIDSGDLHAGSIAARALLDELGATNTRITVSGDLDEYTISTLADAPIDAYGAGTKLVTGSGVPTCGFVMKLTAIADTYGQAAVQHGVAKRSNGKASRPGRHVAWRELDANGHAVAERIIAADSVENIPSSRPERALQIRYMDRGRRLNVGTLNDARAHCAAALRELPDISNALTCDGPAIPTNN